MIFPFLLLYQMRKRIGGINQFPDEKPERRALQVGLRQVPYIDSRGMLSGM